MPLYAFMVRHAHCFRHSACLSRCPSLRTSVAFSDALMAQPSDIIFLMSSPAISTPEEHASAPPFSLFSVREIAASAARERPPNAAIDLPHLEKSAERLRRTRPIYAIAPERQPLFTLTRAMLFSSPQTLLRPGHRHGFLLYSAAVVRRRAVIAARGCRHGACGLLLRYYCSAATICRCLLNAHFRRRYVSPPAFTPLPTLPPPRSPSVRHIVFIRHHARRMLPSYAAVTPEQSPNACFFDAPLCAAEVLCV